MRWRGSVQKELVDEHRVEVKELGSEKKGNEKKGNEIGAHDRRSGIC